MGSGPRVGRRERDGRGRRQIKRIKMSCVHGSIPHDKCKILKHISGQRWKQLPTADCSIAWPHSSWFLASTGYRVHHSCLAQLSPGLCHTVRVHSPLLRLLALCSLPEHRAHWGLQAISYSSLRISTSVPCNETTCHPSHSSPPQRTSTSGEPGGSLR